MRLFILLAALFPLLDAKFTASSRYFYTKPSIMINSQNKLVNVTKFILPQGLVDGDILSFSFRHVGNGSQPESVAINCYERVDVEADGVFNIETQLRLDRNLTHPVTSNAYESEFNKYWYLDIDHNRMKYPFDIHNRPSGKWLTPTVIEQHLDELPPSNGLWRIDLIKHDNYHMNVFFQGYWSGAHSVKNSLNGINTIYFISDFVDQSSITASLKRHHRGIAPPSADEFLANINGEAKTATEAISLNSFRGHAAIWMTAVLRATGGENHNEPAIFITPSAGGTPYIKIFQKWEGDTENLYITSSNGNATLCGSEMTRGDFHNLIIKREAGKNNLIQLGVNYNWDTFTSEVTCEHTLPEQVAKMLHEKIHIQGHDGAMILHFDHNGVRSITFEPYGRV